MEQKSWSKTTSLHGPFRDRQSNRQRPRYSDNKKYCKIVDLKGQSDYDNNFNKGLLVKVSFELDDLNSAYSDKWYVLDIEHNIFIERYGSLESAKVYLIGSSACLIHKPNAMLSGKIVLVADLSKAYDSGEKSDSFNITSLSAGFSEGSTSKFRVIKYDYTKDSNTGIKLSDKSVELIGDESNFISVNDKGIGISGKVNFQTNPSNVTFGLIFGMPDFIRGSIPSTITTPNPLFLPTIPTDLLLSLGDLASKASGWLA